MKRESIIFFFLLLKFVSFSQVVIDSTIPVIEPTDTSIAIQKVSIVIPPFILINSDTIKLGEFDELVCDSYCAAAVPSVYDALHSFHSRRVDKFGGYINHKVNILVNTNSNPEIIFFKNMFLHNNFKNQNNKKNYDKKLALNYLIYQ